MARSRMVKPEFFQDEKLGDLSVTARLLFIGTWCCSDDYGVVKGNPKWLKAQIFPYDEISLEEFTRVLGELVTMRRLLLFMHQDEVYYLIVNFTEHQKVDRPSKTRNPYPPAAFFEVLQQIQEFTRVLSEPSQHCIDQTETETETETETSTPSQQVATPLPDDEKKVDLKVEEKTGSTFNELVGNLITDGIEARAELNHQQRKNKNGNKPESVEACAAKLKELCPTWTDEVCTLRAEQWYCGIESKYPTPLTWRISGREVKDWVAALRSKITYWKQDDLKHTGNGNQKNNSSGSAGLTASIKGVDYSNQPGNKY